MSDMGNFGFYDTLLNFIGSCDILKIAATSFCLTLSWSQMKMATLSLWKCK